MPFRRPIRAIARFAVVGQSAPQPFFEVRGRTGALAAAQANLRQCYAEGLAAYRACRFDAARAAFNAALESVPGDGPSLAMLARVAQFDASPPPADWDGAWRMDSK